MPKRHLRFRESFFLLASVGVLLACTFPCVFHECSKGGHCKSMVHTKRSACEGLMRSSSRCTLLEDTFLAGPLYMWTSACQIKVSPMASGLRLRGFSSPQTSLKPPFLASSPCTSPDRHLTPDTENPLPTLARSYPPPSPPSKPCTQNSAQTLSRKPKTQEENSPQAPNPSK